MTALLSIGMVALATFTIFAYLAFIWWLDRYDREPIWLVMLAFFWGGIGGTLFAVFITMPFVVVSSAIFDGEVSDVLTTVLFAPTIEEATKAAIFIVLVLFHQFDNETDGLIYGAATGLGFACVENLLYFSNTSSFEELATLVVMRTALTAVVHTVSSSMIGMAVGFVRQRRFPLWSSAALIFLAYLAAVINHATWNTIAATTGALGAEGGGGAVFLVGTGIVFGGALLMFLLTQISVYREHKMIHRILQAEVQIGTLPASHAQVIPFWLARKNSNWLDPRIQRKKYIRTATLLAFRIQRLPYFKEGPKKNALLQEIASLRATIRQLLVVYTK